MSYISLKPKFYASTNLGQSKKMMSAVGYALKALMYLESVWITKFNEFNDKITIGLGLGLTANAFGEAHSRLMEMNTSVLVLESSTHIENFFKESALEDNPDRIKSRIYALTRELHKSAQDYSANVHNLFDYPTLEALRAIEAAMAQKIFFLDHERWGTLEQAPSIILSSQQNVVVWNQQDICPKPVDMPGRPSSLKRDDVSILNAPSSKLIQTNEGLQRLLHFIYADIEVLAAEVCARNISDYGADMPVQFSLDMARQVSDECRHAIMIGDALESAGGKLGDFTYTNRVWTSYMKGNGLAEKLAIQQVVDEGNGLDTSAVLVKALAMIGRDDLITLYEFLMADETVHCSYGNKWLSFLNKGDAARYESVIDQTLQKTGSRVPGGAPVNIDARRAAQYPEWFINNRLLANRECS